MAQREAADLEIAQLTGTLDAVPPGQPISAAAAPGSTHAASSVEAQAAGSLTADALAEVPLIESVVQRLLEEDQALEDVADFEGTPEDQPTYGQQGLTSPGMLQGNGLGTLICANGVVVR